jgi:hypothetical protein
MPRCVSQFVSIGTPAQASTRRQDHQRTPASLGLENRPDKTFIGRVEKGFDFLGYHLSPRGLSVAPATMARFLDRVHRLYEQERGKHDDSPLLGAYVRRWQSWTRGGLPGIGPASPASQRTSGTMVRLAYGQQNG